MARSYSNVAKLPLEAERFSFNEAFPVEAIMEFERDHEPLSNMHIHNALELGYCHEGKGTIWIDTKILPYERGDITVITPHEYHRSQSLKGIHSRWSWFFIDPVKLLVPHLTTKISYNPRKLSGPLFSNSMKASVFPQLSRIIEEMIDEYQGKREHYKESFRALFFTFLNRLDDIVRDYPSDSRSDEKKENLSRIIPALEYITTNYENYLNVSECAKRTGMGIRRFQTIFKDVIGKTPRDYCTEFRIRTAEVMLLSTDKNISQVAFDVGFNTLSSFNRSFKRISNRTPRELRHNQIE